MAKTRTLEGDLISRQEAVDAIDALHDKPNAWLDSAVDAVMALPSAQPKILACGEGELNVPDTNVGDMISRQTVLRCLIDISYNQCKTQGEADVIDTAKTMVSVMPSTQPEPSDSVYRLYKRAYEAGQRNAQPELHYDEWCTDCKEYDQERHCCPRWNRVIRETLKDARPEIIRCKDCKYADDDGVCQNSIGLAIQDDDDFCSRAERRADERSD